VKINSSSSRGIATFYL